MGQKSSTLTPEVIRDLKDSTEFEYAEISDLYRQFRLDCGPEEGSLHMTAEDFKKMYREVFPKGDADRFAEHVFRTFDREGKGHINFREFMNTLSVQLKGGMQDKLEWSFNLYDINKTGYITRDELLEMIRSMYNLHAGALPAEDHIKPKQLCDHIFERADKAGDNKLSKHEFMEGASQSKTFQMLLQGTAAAASSPYLRRKERSGSFGKPRAGSLGAHGTHSSTSPKSSPKSQRA